MSQPQVYIRKTEDKWTYPGRPWVVFKPGERIGDEIRSRRNPGRGFRDLASAKEWASAEFGVAAWKRLEDGRYVPKDGS